MNTVEALDKLAELKAQADALRLDWEAKRTAIMAPVMAEVNALDCEYAPLMEAVQQKAADMEAAVKDAVIANGATVKGAYLQAVYAKGRVSWDGKALDGYAAAHPEITTFRTVGAPSVSIRQNGKA